MSTEGLMDPVPGVEPTKGGLYLWRYPPSIVAAVLFLLLFLATFLYTSWKIWSTRAWFCTVFAIGCFLEMVGYGIRAGAHNNTGKLMPYIVQNMFILVAPVLFAASVYMTLGRIISSVGGDSLSPIKPSRITLTFVLGDIVSFMIQGGGAGMSAVQNASLSKWAPRIVLIGLVIQIVMFGLFCLISVIFHRRMRSVQTSGNSSWEAGLYMLYSVSLLIIVRSIFRVVEYAQGQTGYSLSHEWTLYVFDSVLMFSVTAIFAWRFPGHFSAKFQQLERFGNWEMS